MLQAIRQFFCEHEWETEKTSMGKTEFGTYHPLHGTVLFPKPVDVEFVRVVKFCARCGKVVRWDEGEARMEVQLPAYPEFIKIDPQVLEAKDGGQ